MLNVIRNQTIKKSKKKKKSVLGLELYLSTKTVLFRKCVFWSLNLTAFSPTTYYLIIIIIIKKRMAAILIWNSISTLYYNFVYVSDSQAGVWLTFSSYILKTAVVAWTFLNVIITLFEQECVHNYSIIIIASLEYRQNFKT